MYYRIIRNDILRNKAITLTTMVFVAAAAMLVSLAAILIINLSGAIDTLMTRAKTPHFMQMHSGPMDIGQLAAFAAQNGDVAEFQVLEFINVDGARIVFEKSSLADSVQDNGFSVQSEKFDYLLDLDGNMIRVSDGEIYVPICYMQDGSTKVGDTVEVFGREFIVGGFLRDSLMNSLLASSKRFLVSRNDFMGIGELGNVEYLIEFRLKDISALGAFENAYTSAGLDANGPTLTYPLFKTMNAISDGLMIAVILLVSVLVVMIAFMCIRFTLLAKIEEDYREIGVMKAIGLRVSDIKKIYLAKYAAIAAVGSLLGYTLSFVFRDMLLENIRLYMGESENASFARFAFKFDSALHQFCKTSAYCKPQTGSSVFAGTCPVSLSKSRKQTISAFERNADSRVSDRKRQKYRVLCFLKADYPDLNFASFGEFYSITRQIDENLLDTQGIADKKIRYIRRFVNVHLNPFERSLISEQIRQILENTLQAERFFFSHQLSCFDFGEIEDIVENAQKGP